jgi:uncharacterized membrane protein YhdT
MILLGLKNTCAIIAAIVCSYLVTTTTSVRDYKTYEFFKPLDIIRPLLFIVLYLNVCSHFSLLP